MGYESTRFVELNSDLEDELTCVICCNILCEPVVTPCCHSFCRECVGRWLKDFKSCPVCRKPCYKICKSPVIVTNLIGRLRIRCDNEEKGCNEVMAVERLSSHTKVCSFKPKRSILTNAPKAIRTFFKSFFAPFAREEAVNIAEYDTEIVDDFSGIGQNNNQNQRQISRSEDVIHMSLQSIALVGFVYNIFNLLRS